MKITRLIIVSLLSLSSLSLLASVSVSLNTLADNGLIQASDGSLLPDGSVARVGTFDIDLTTLNASELLDYSLVNSHFSEWTSFAANTGAIAGPGEYFETKELDSLTGNPQLYLWVFNGSTPSTSEQYGLFSSTSTAWDAANNLGVNTLLSSAIDQIFVGSSDESDPTNYLLAPVPEPAHYAAFLGMMGLALVIWRRRR